jgi:hypothetical protein
MRIMKTAAASIIALCIVASAGAQEPVHYRFDAVKRKVLVAHDKQEIKAEKGQHAQSGDKVQTGWFSYALLAAEKYAAKFEIYALTDVQLSSGEPGVILSVERGRIRAAFDKITGDEPRVVQTPGALLAVRGTSYDVEVGKDGRTTLDVWEGTVEVRSKLAPEPVLVHAGEESIFGRRQPPVVRPMPERRRMNDPMRPRTEGAPRDPMHGDPRGTQPGHGMPAPMPKPSGGGRHG